MGSIRILSGRVQCFLYRMIMTLMILSISLSLAAYPSVLAAGGETNLVTTVHDSSTHLNLIQTTPSDSSDQTDPFLLGDHLIQTLYPSESPVIYLNPQTELNAPYGSASFATPEINYPIVDIPLFARQSVRHSDMAPDAVGSISGHVYETGSNIPVANATIYVNTNDQNYSYGNAQTDASGYFQVTGLEPRSDYKIQAWSAGHLRAFYPSIARWSNATNIQVLSGQDTPNMDIHIIRADSHITGRVTNTDNSPAANVWMEAFHQDGWFVGINANSNGEYSIPVTEGIWDVFPYAPPLASQSKSVSITTGQTVANINFVLESPGSISGHIFDDHGQVISDALISVHASGTSAGSSSRGTYVSQVDGSYTITGLAAGTYKVEANNNRDNFYISKYYVDTYSWSLAELVTVTAGQTKGDIDFTLAPAGKISGVVRKADGSPVQGACVNVSSSAQTWNQVGGWGRTGADGSFIFGGIPTGQVYIKTHANCGGLNPSLIDEWYASDGSTPDSGKASAVTITAGQVTPDINFNLDVGGSISGFVYQANGSTPIANVRVYAMDTQFRYVKDGYSQTNGNYQITGLGQGNYYLAVQANGFGGVYYPNGYDDPGAVAVGVTPPNNTPNINFNLSPEATVTGFVYQSDGHTPIVGAKISIEPGNGGQIRSAYSGADGAYTVYGLSSGAYIAKADATGFETEYYLNTWSWSTATRFDVTQPQNRAGINFTLPTQGILPPVAERQSLEALYDATSGPGWTNQTGWKINENICTWYGITCYDGHVVGINLNTNNLTGPLPVNLSNLSNLQALSLQNNKLTGSIPSELGNLSNLQTLYLQFNQLTGSILPELGNLSKLTGLSLQSNQLTGSIPPQLGNLSNLQTLYLYSNQLTGSIPPELGNLSKLIGLNLRSNQLTGTIPPELGNLSNIQTLHLYSNQLTGSIPPELGNLSNLRYLYLHSNRLTGGIPSQLSNLSNLQRLYLYSNQLTGSIPLSFTALTSLQDFKTNGTWLCESHDAGFQAWKATVATWTSPGLCYSISGQVTRSGAALSGEKIVQLGAPLSGVTISDGIHTTHSGADGTYTLADLPPGSYTLTLILPGYIFSPASHSVTLTNANLTAQNFSATPNLKSYLPTLRR
jgi:Leucine-rich repeat (LRR) protein